MEGSRAFVAIVALSLAEASPTLTLPQWRVLAIVNRHGAQNLTAIARWMGVHPSTATRACDVLVRSGLLRRREDPADRRRLVLTLTPKGQRFVDSMLQRRREAIARVLELMPAARRLRLAEAMEEFAAAVGDAPEPMGQSVDWVH
jgi:DNA-binding MarR family transcriptional regulator